MNGYSRSVDALGVGRPFLFYHFVIDQTSAVLIITDLRFGAVDAHSARQYSGAGLGHGVRFLRASCWGAGGPATGAAPASGGSTKGCCESGKPAEPAFDILEFRVEGNTVLASREIERAVNTYLGRNGTF